jgi:pyruvate kinase
MSRLLEAGADVFRLNLSHGSPEEHLERIRRVRALELERGRPLPVLLDLMGPRFRLGTLPEGGRELRRGEHLVLGDPSKGADLPLDDPTFVRYLENGERILIDNGLVELKVIARHRNSVEVRVRHGGRVSSRKGINLPDSNIPFSITPKDRADLELATEVQADFIAASYIGRAKDVETLRQELLNRGAEIPIVAKLERAQAVQHIEEIVRAADAVMVARGDLGVEVALHEVPVLQKRIVAAGRRLGKPVIVATQMLESMMEHPRPTRAEVSDVANAIFDGADAVMLSGETAAGKFPVESVRMMAQIVVEAEAYVKKVFEKGEIPRDPQLPAGRFPAPAPRVLQDPSLTGAVEIADVVAAAGVHAASKLPGSSIVAFSQGGFTARRLARYRPVVPTYVLTTDLSVARRVQLLWGMTPIHLEHEVQHREDLLQAVERELLIRRLVQPGECLILLMGYPIHERPLTNLMRIHRIPRP